MTIKLILKPVDNKDTISFYSDVYKIKQTSIIMTELDNSITLDFGAVLTDQEAHDITVLFSNYKDIQPEQPSLTITKYQFRQKFTFEERKKLDTSTDEDIQVLKNDLSSCEFVDLLDPNIQLGLSLLVYKGLITEERRKQILEVWYDHRINF